MTNVNHVNATKVIDRVTDVAESTFRLPERI
jgi:hypothetical protein